MKEGILLNVGSGALPIDPDVFLTILNNFLRLNVKPLEEWKEMKLDLMPFIQPDVVSNMMEISIRDNTVDIVWAFACLEHLYDCQVEVALKEFYRVLKPGGFLTIMVPDTEGVARVIIEYGLKAPLYDSDVGSMAAIDILWGSRKHLKAGWVQMAHRTGFTPETVKEDFKAIGFKDVHTATHKWSMWAVGHKL